MRGMQRDQQMYAQSVISATILRGKFGTLDASSKVTEPLTAIGFPQYEQL